MCVYIPSCKSFLYTQPRPAKVGISYCPSFTDKPQKAKAPAPRSLTHSSQRDTESPCWFYFFICTVPGHTFKLECFYICKCL